MSQETQETPAGVRAGISTSLVPDRRRLDFLPQHFGARTMLRFEGAVYDWMRNLCPSYGGGFWNYVELSNGGAFMFPADGQQYELRVDGNCFHDRVSAEVAGIITTAFALNGMLWRGYEGLREKCGQLDEFIAQHSERGTIRSALD